MNLEFTREDLTEEPQTRELNMGRVIFVFNVKLSDKTEILNTGAKFTYEQEIYEIMNRESIDSPDNYVKFNCVRKTANQPAASTTAE